MQLVPFSLGNALRSCTPSMPEMHHNKRPTELTPPWPESLPEELATSGDQELLAPIGLDRSTYGTARMMLRRADASREVVASLQVDERRRDRPILIEQLPPSLGETFAEHDLAFAKPATITESGILTTIAVALQRHLTHLPWVLASVRDLVRVIHILESDGDEYDTSYSNPDIPFSIFLSIPKGAHPEKTLRVVESIIHETMHLQLTLFEKHIPLLRPFSEAPHFYSPWKKTYREAGGILHALYVFRVIEEFWSKAADLKPDATTHQFATLRCLQIEEEIATISQFVSCPTLTPEGRELVARLLVKRSFAKSLVSCWYGNS